MADPTKCSCLEVFGEDPNCPVHGTDALEARLAEKDARIGELEAAVAVQRESKEYAQRCCVTAEAQLTASRAECEGLRAALDQIKKLKPSPIADTPFCTGPLLLFQAAQRIAHAALSQKETGA